MLLTYVFVCLKEAQYVETNVKEIKLKCTRMKKKIDKLIALFRSLSLAKHFYYFSIIHGH